jgi:hypothetical protein
MDFIKKESTTRRCFVKEVTGAAIAGVLFGLESTAAQAPQTEKDAALSAQRAAFATGGNGEQLVAPCGLYCGACPMYLATQSRDEQKSKALLEQFGAGKMKFTKEDLQCDGCLGKGKLATFCRSCALRSCAAGKPKVVRCSDCSDFPCSRITNFNNDGMLHHSEVLANLRGIREMGIAAWTRHEDQRWHCAQCSTPIAWYDKACSVCGAKRSEHLFPLKQS